jgi:hypothetical protein
MEKVSVYKLSNGELIEDREKAIKRQNQINFDKQIDELVNRQNLHSDEEIAVRNFIDCNIPDLKKIFDLLDC